MANQQDTIRLVIEGMTCGGCAKTVTALLQKAGFEVDEVNHETGIAIVRGNVDNIQSAQSLIEAAGYKIKEFHK